MSLYRQTGDYGRGNIDTILQSGPVLLLHGFGNLLGPLLALPVAILLGMKREAIGSCHSINREYHMALD